ncbi:uncharacterized vacuolar membrane protein YML018C-like isoform X2 [Daucus carota subsp. sativus]|uniref:uncharacterized vacuolar membrane protein YML018C-like isoform X2 n=1 Tax=Daucus carota subsp. sativus TaxID=79200 RepID=UPI0007EEF969|nr:PREDICTED: uncharacterized vacuolar membrane protein YML018C-like isoform X2 [Daucus carota subsp. sativus]
MRSEVWRWGLGLSYIVLVAIIWIASSFVVQSVVDSGVSPFLITYTCNSLFVVYLPLVEIGRCLKDMYSSLVFCRKDGSLLKRNGSEEAILLSGSDSNYQVESLNQGEVEEKSEPLNCDGIVVGTLESDQTGTYENVDDGLDERGRWTRIRVAKSNTILSSASSLFTFLVSLAFLGETFTLVKLISVLLCMGGTIIVSLGDSESGLRNVASKPLLGDILALISAALYSVYITLIRKHIPDDDVGNHGHVSMAQVLGFLGLFNLLIFLPVALALNFTKLEPFSMLTWKQFGLIVGKGLIDNVLSDYLWAKAVLLTTTTVATAGLTIQVPLAALVDSVTGNAPHTMDYVGAAAVLVGFVGINIPSGTFSRSLVSLE